VDNTLNVRMHKVDAKLAAWAKAYERLKEAQAKYKTPTTTRRESDRLRDSSFRPTADVCSGELTRTDEELLRDPGDEEQAFPSRTRSPPL
jgi:hypothetical protein